MLSKQADPEFESTQEEQDSNLSEEEFEKTKRKRDDEEEEIPEKAEAPEEQEISEEPKKKKRTRKVHTVLPTSDPNIEVQVREPKGRPKKHVVYVYKDDMPKDKVTIVEKSHTRGRPKLSEVEVERHLLLNQEDTWPKKKMGVREARRLELLDKHIEFEKLRGKKLRQNKSGKTDRRSYGERSEAQMESARRLVELNKLKKAEKSAEKKNETKETVKTVISELAVKSKIKKAEAPQPKPLSRRDHMFRNFA